MFLFLILGLLLGAISVIFVLQNITDATVTFLVWQIHGSLALILLLALLSGVCISLLMYIPESIRSHFTVSALKKKNKKLEEDLINQKKVLDETQAKLISAEAAASTYTTNTA